MARPSRNVPHFGRRPRESGKSFRCPIFPLTDVHLHSNKSGELEANSNIQFVYIFSVIAVLILLIACVNFMNLSTARSANRAREVGIRKVAGSTKGHLIIQFLTESILLSLFSLVLALCIAVLLLPMFNQLAGKSLHPNVLFSGRFLPSSSSWCCWSVVSLAATPLSTFPPFSRFMY
jgi:ABC-type transport system, involved in lipoprotein release, permease component